MERKFNARPEERETLENVKEGIERCSKDKKVSKEKEILIR